MLVSHSLPLLSFPNLHGHRRPPVIVGGSGSGMAHLVGSALRSASRQARSSCTAARRGLPLSMGVTGRFRGTSDADGT
jgi:hypothetical protein